MGHDIYKQTPFYRRRNPAASLFFRIVQKYFDDFERVYPERYEKKYGFWRKVIRTSVDKFLKCGDLKEGFARVKCKDCGEEFFVAYSCRQRCCCPSCDQKRALLLGHRLKDEVLANVPHRQWVFTIPKRLRVYFRFDRSLLGKLCRAAWETVRDVYALEVDGDSGVPAMVGAVQTFGDLVHWHSHVHTIVVEGVFTESGHFVHIPNVWLHRAIEIWQEKVFSLLLDVGKIDPDVVSNMRGWRHSGFSVDTSVRIEAGDHAGMQRLVEYISRCPFSLTRMVSITKDDKVLYRTSKAECIPFPKTGDNDLSSGMSRNYEIYNPLDFLAEVTQHIPNKGEHQIRFYGWYSNKKRGIAEKTNKPVMSMPPGMPGPDTTYRRKCRMTWAALIKCVYEVDPLKCPKCRGEMRIVAFIEEKTLIEKILRHCNIWQERKPHPPPKPPPNQLIPPVTVERSILDFDFFERNCA